MDLRKQRYRSAAHLLYCFTGRDKCLWVGFPMGLLRRDGPWSVIVCGAAFLSQVIGGGVQTSGLYYAYFRSTFDVSSVATSWLCSMAFVGWFLGTTIGGPIIKRFGFRVCSFSGSLLSSFGFAMCLVSNTYYLLFLFFGIFGCIGNGLQVCGFFTAVNAYFDRYIRSAQNLASVGVGIGISIYSVVFTDFIETYGWRGALLLQAGFSLNGCALACLLFPIPSTNATPKTIRYSLILKPRVILTCLHFYFVVIPESIVYVHLPMLLTSKGFSVETSSLGLLILGISSLVSRVIYSIPCKIGVTKLYTLNLCVGGVLMFSLSFLNVLWTIFVCLAGIGITFIVYGGLNLLVLRKVVEDDEFIDLAALAFTFKTVGAISSGPIAGLIFDLTQDYKYEFWLSSIIAITASLFLVPNIMRKGCSYTKERDSTELVTPGEKISNTCTTNIS